MPLFFFFFFSLEIHYIGIRAPRSRLYLGVLGVVTFMLRNACVSNWGDNLSYLVSLTIEYDM